MKLPNGTASLTMSFRSNVSKCDKLKRFVYNFKDDLRLLYFVTGILGIAQYKKWSNTMDDSKISMVSAEYDG